MGQPFPVSSHIESHVVNLILKIVAEASPREANADGDIDTNCFTIRHDVLRSFTVLRGLLVKRMCRKTLDKSP